MILYLHCDLYAQVHLKDKYRRLHTLIYACVWQSLHRLEVRVNRGAEGKSGKVFVGSLSEERAMELAGKFVSEAFVWGVRSSHKAAFSL